MLYSKAVHCKWGDWENGTCSVLCGTGTEKKTRTKLVIEHNGGTCTGQNTEEVICEMDPCPSKKRYIPNPMSLEFKEHLGLIVLFIFL